MGRRWKRQFILLVCFTVFLAAGLLRETVLLCRQLKTVQTLSRQIMSEGELLPDTDRADAAGAGAAGIHSAGATGASNGQGTGASGMSGTGASSGQEANSAGAAGALRASVQECEETDLIFIPISEEYLEWKFEYYNPKASYIAGEYVPDFYTIEKYLLDHFYGEYESYGGEKMVFNQKYFAGREYRITSMRKGVEEIDLLFLDSMEEVTFTDHVYQEFVTHLIYQGKEYERVENIPLGISTERLDYSRKFGAYQEYYKPEDSYEPEQGHVERYALAYPLESAEQQLGKFYGYWTDVENGDVYRFNKSKFMDEEYGVLNVRRYFWGSERTLSWIYLMGNPKDVYMVEYCPDCYWDASLKGGVSAFIEREGTHTEMIIWHEERYIRLVPLTEELMEKSAVENNSVFQEAYQKVKYQCVAAKNDLKPETIAELVIKNKEENTAETRYAAAVGEVLQVKRSEQLSYGYLEITGNQTGENVIAFSYEGYSPFIKGDKVALYGQVRGNTPYTSTDTSGVQTTRETIELKVDYFDTLLEQPVLDEVVFWVIGTGISLFDGTFLGEKCSFETLERSISEGNSLYVGIRFKKYQDLYGKNGNPDYHTFCIHADGTISFDTMALYDEDEQIIIVKGQELYGKRSRETGE